MKSISRSVLFLLLFFSVSFSFVPLSASAALVPCGRTSGTADEMAPCTVCHVVLGGKGIIDWGLKIMTVVAIVVIVAMAIFYIVSTGNEKMLQIAKSGIKAALVGFALMLSAWLIVNVILTLLVSTQFLSSIKQTNSFTFSCSTISSAGTSMIAAGGSSIVPVTGLTLATSPSSGAATAAVLPGGSTTVFLAAATGINLSAANPAIVSVGVGPLGMIQEESPFAFLGIQTVLAASASDITVTPAVLTSMEQLRSGITIKANTGIQEGAQYNMTIHQGSSLLGTVNITVATSAIASRTATTTTSTPPEDVAWGKVLDGSGNPVNGVLYCGDPNRNDYTTYNTNFPGGAVGITKSYCIEKGGKVWVQCPVGMSVSPAEMAIENFNGQTFVCATSSDTVWGKVLDGSGNPVNGVLYCGDPNRNDYTTYNTNFPGGAVGITKSACLSKGGKVWVQCPTAITASPAQMTVEEFNGKTFVCAVSSETVWGKVVDGSGNPVNGALYCGDPTRNDYTTYNTNYPNGAVGISKSACLSKGGKVWVQCPTTMTVSPAQMMVEEFNGNTFTCMNASEKVSLDPAAAQEADITGKCNSGVYDSKFAICRPPAERLQYLKESFAQARKPMSLAFVNSFGPGFTDSEKAFADWNYVIIGPLVVSCDEAVSEYGLFGGDKNNLGNWAEGSNSDFYDYDGKFIGSGGAKIGIAQYKDKVTGEPMTEREILFGAIGYCHH